LSERRWNQQCHAQRHYCQIAGYHTSPPLFDPVQTGSFRVSRQKTPHCHGAGHGRSLGHHQIVLPNEQLKLLACSWEFRGGTDRLSKETIPSKSLDL
jgi:hypothetical protein